MDTTLPDSGTENSQQHYLNLEQALQTYPQWQHVECVQPPVVIEPFDAGLTNQCYLVQAGDKRCVMRLNARNSRVMGLDRVNEAVALHNAETAGLGAPIVYCSPEQGVLVTAYIEGRQWTQAQGQTRFNLERLAGLLKQVHALPVTNKVLEPRQVTDHYWNGIRDQFVIIPPRFKALRQKMERLMLATLSDYPQRCFCHNDMVCANIIDTGNRLFLLDWEYAAMGDPLFDVAVIVHNHQLDEQQMSYFLECYSGTIDSATRKQFLSNYAIYIYIDMLWYWFQSASHPRQGFAAIAEGKLDTLVAVLHELGIG